MPDYWEYTPPFTDTPPAWDEVPEGDRDKVLFDWLEHAIDEGINPVATDILTRRPDWVNAFRNPDDEERVYCPLVAAVEAENPEMVAWLLDHGADLVCGNEPLCVVARKLWPTNMSAGRTAVLRIAKMLLDRGASPDQPCELHGQTPREKFFAVARQDLAQFILSHQ